jgi:hypothetical protein
VARVREDGLSGDRRLGLYRNNTLSSLTEALAGVYPVVQRLVGERFFAYASRQFIGGHPSLSGNLHDFGGEFAAFLEALEAAAGLPYLADVARLEWAYHRVFHAAEHPSLELLALGRVPPERFAELRFELHPASRLLASPFPVLRIWEVNQEGYRGEEVVDLAAGGVELLVRRPGLTVQIEPLGHGEFRLLEHLARGLTLVEAFSLAVEADPDLDLQACLRRHVLEGTLVGLTLNEPASAAEAPTCKQGDER